MQYVVCVCVCIQVLARGTGVNGAALPQSFLAKSSPQQIVKAETKAVRDCVCVCLRVCVHVSVYCICVCVCVSV